MFVRPGNVSSAPHWESSHKRDPRATQDLDFFTSIGHGNVGAARDSFERAVEHRGWEVRRIRDAPTFCRLMLSGPEDLIVDIAVDSPPGRQPTVTFVGPTYDPEELAGRKVIALFDRAEARDFADVHDLAQRFGKNLLLERAAEVDAGFDMQVFAEMLRTLSRFIDADVPVDDVGKVRQFFASWVDELKMR
ncbi:MAG: nucleotidyl transferase AbiEii/AbiGii toxin family protein [Acidimicrobiales bacterium]